MLSSRLLECLGDFTGAAQAAKKAQQAELAGSSFEKAAAREQDPDQAAKLLKDAAAALLKSRNFSKCFELALKHADKFLFPPKASL